MKQYITVQSNIFFDKILIKSTIQLTDCRKSTLARTTRGTVIPVYVIMITIIRMRLGIVDNLLSMNSHVDRIESEDNRRVCSYPQSPNSESLTLNIAQQRNTKTVQKASKVARGSSRKASPYCNIIIKPSSMVNSTSTDVPAVV